MTERQRRVRVIGHRGAAGLAPENTLPGFETAIEWGVDAVECDVRLSLDGAMVIMHDKTVDRTTNGSGPVAALTLADLRKLDAGDGAQVPLLEEVLDVVAGRVEMLVEIKAPEALTPVVELLLARSLTDGAVITSFHHALLPRAQRCRHRVRTGAIFREAPANAAARTAAMGAEGLGVRWNHLHADLVEKVRASGLTLRGWAANSEEAFRRCVELGVDGITTDYPDRCLTFLRS